MMCDNFQSFAMFSEAGDKAVAGIVARAKSQGWDWPRTQAELYVLANSDAQLYGEATDTAVREVVYDALNFETNFYI